MKTGSCLTDIGLCVEPVWQGLSNQRPVIGRAAKLMVTETSVSRQHPSLHLQILETCYKQWRWRERHSDRQWQTERERRWYDQRKVYEGKTRSAWEIDVASPDLHNERVIPSWVILIRCHLTLLTNDGIFSHLCPLLPPGSSSLATHLGSQCLVAKLRLLIDHLFGVRRSDELVHGPECVWGLNRTISHNLQNVPLLSQWDCFLNGSLPNHTYTLFILHEQQLTYSYSLPIQRKVCAKATSR